jgi:hypothetical protein
MFDSVGAGRTFSRASHNLQEVLLRTPSEHNCRPTASSLVNPCYTWSSAVQSSQDPQSVTVYVTKTGKKYHRDGCRYLAASKIKTTLKEAKANGYTPCKVCHPSA